MRALEFITGHVICSVMIKSTNWRPPISGFNCKRLKNENIRERDGCSVDPSVDFIRYRGFTPHITKRIFCFVEHRFKIPSLMAVWALGRESIMFCISQSMPTSYCLIYILRAGVWVKITDNNWICMGEAIDQAESGRGVVSSYVVILPENDWSCIFYTRLKQNNRP